MFLVLKWTVSPRRFFWAPKACFGWEKKKIIFLLYTLLTKVWTMNIQINGQINMINDIKLF